MGARYRVVRADTFIRSGPAGPEPPRSSDPDPGEPGRAHELADPAAGFVIDPVTATGIAEGALKAELLEAVYPKASVPAESVPAEVRADSVRAVRAHPGGVLPSAADTTAELAGGGGLLGPGRRRHRKVSGTGWRFICGCSGLGGVASIRGSGRCTPQLWASWMRGAAGIWGRGAAVPGSPGRAAGADRAGRARGPQPSDYDPQPPVKVQEQRLSEEGAAGDDDEKAPIELDEDTQRLAGLVREEEQQRWARLANRTTMIRLRTCNPARRQQPGIAAI